MDKHMYIVVSSIFRYQSKIILVQLFDVTYIYEYMYLPIQT